MASLTSLVVEKRDGWFTLGGVEGVFHIDLETGICNCENDIINQNTELFVERLIKYKNYIILLPTKKIGTIDIFNIQKKMYEYRIMPDMVEDCYMDNAVVYNNYICFVNNNSTDPAIIIFDINNWAFLKKICIDKQKLWKSESCGRIFSKDIVMKEDILILASSSSCYIVKVNLTDYSIEYSYIPCSLSGFVTMCNNDEDYWFTDENAMTVQYNSEYVVQEYDLKQIYNLEMDLFEGYELELKKRPGYKNSYMYFNTSIYRNGNIFWVPGRANIILKLDTINNEWSSIYYRPDINGTSSWLLCPTQNNEELYLFSVREEQLLKIDTSCLEVEKMAFDFKIKDKTIVVTSGVCDEINGIPYTLNDFIKNIFVTNTRSNFKDNGRIIYNEFV